MTRCRPTRHFPDCRPARSPSPRRVPDRPRFESVDVPQIDIADRRRPDIKIVRSRILRRLTGDGTGVIDDDVDAFGPVVIVKGAARDLRVVNLGLDAVEVL